jgi:hypothetical protein
MNFILAMRDDNIFLVPMGRNNITCYRWILRLGWKIDDIVQRREGNRRKIRCSGHVENYVRSTCRCRATES